jgi:iduronate 2-sulfatase
VLPLVSFPDPGIYKGDEPRIMGYAIRTERYRYVEWLNFRTNEVEATELYDNQTDPREINNIVNAPGYSALVNELKQKLSAGWQKALLHEAK